MAMLHIPNFMGESYYYKTISCTEASVATATGYFNYDNYFYYCAYYSLLSIWGPCQNDFLTKCNSILNKLGLEMYVASISSKEDFYFEIENALQKNIPICLLLDYFYMFYCDFNYQERHGEHGIIVCGINEKKSTVTIMDCAHIGFDNPMQRLTLKQDMLWDMWKNADSFFRENFDRPNAVAFIKPKHSDQIINSEYDFLKDLVQSNYITERDNLIDNIILNDNFDVFFSEIYKRDLVDSLKPVFDLLDKLFIKNQIDKDSDWFGRYNNIKQKYLSARSKMYLRIIKKFYKSEKLEKKNRDKYIDDIQTMNAELRMFLEDLYSYMENEENPSMQNYIHDRKLMDFAPNAFIEASSELEAYDTKFSAERVINGQYGGFDKDMWASNDEITPHWLMLDLGRRINIYKFTVIHALDEGNYVMLNWDEFFVPNGITQSNHHFSHKTLLYGYNLDKACFFTAGFNNTMRYAHSEVSFDAFVNAFFSEVNDRNPAYHDTEICLMKFNSDFSYQLNINTLVQQLNDFYFSRSPLPKYCSHFNVSYDVDCFSNDNRFIFGMDVYKCLQSYIELSPLYLGSNVKQFQTLWGNADSNFQPFQTLLEHKKVMVDRIQFLKRHRYLHEECDFDTAYKKIEMNAKKIRNYFIKYQMNEPGDFIPEMLAGLANIYEDERNVLENMIDELSKYIEK